ncbi:MAG: biotin/lipoyl-binding protein [Proteobacteria bacterium]|nr:biotin/lipoyl-binding protein [Pseudomonadota bacterium]
MTPAQLEAIKKLIDLLADSRIGEIEVSDGEFKVRVVNASFGTPVPPVLATSVGLAPVAHAAPPRPTALSDRLVRAGLHGIFHHAPAPNAPPFVQTGVAVTKGDQLCILEAMKVFTSVRAPCSGVVRTIHVNDGEQVAAGDLLYTLEPIAE